MDPQKSWRGKISVAPDPTVRQVATAMGRGVLEWAVPALKQTTTPDPAADVSVYRKPSQSQSTSLLSTILSPSILLPIGALASIAFGIAKYISISNDDDSKSEKTFRARENGFLTATRLDDLGESGAMLSALGGVFDREVQVERERTGGAPIVEVDMDVRDENGEVGRDVVYRK